MTERSWVQAISKFIPLAHSLEKELDEVIVSTAWAKNILKQISRKGE